jgi:hypothetical protein
MLINGTIGSVLIEGASFSHNSAEDGGALVVS